MAMIKKIGHVINPATGRSVYWLLHRKWNYFEFDYDYFLVELRSPEGTRKERKIPRISGMKIMEMVKA